MSNEIPDLWPAGLNVAEVSPLTILKVQAAKLSERTGGVLTAEVVSRFQGAGELCHRFEIAAPALGYREELFQVRHDESVVYPAAIWAGDSDELREYSDSPGEREFVQALGNLLQSRLVQTHLQGLIARSNDIDASQPV